MITWSKNTKDNELFLNVVVSIIRSAVGKTNFFKNLNSYKRITTEQYVDIMTNYVNSLGIFCLSERSDDILMWSHYSNGHRGVCLQFNLLNSELIEYCIPIKYKLQQYTSK